jgi:hypothetical protein
MPKIFLILAWSFPLLAADPISEVKSGAMTSGACSALMAYVADLRTKEHSAEDLQRLRSQAMASITQPLQTAARATLGLPPQIDPEHALAPLVRNGILANLLQEALSLEGAITVKERADFLRGLSWNQREPKKLAIELARLFRDLYSDDPHSVKNLSLANQWGLTLAEFRVLVENASRPEFFESYLRSQVGLDMGSSFLAMATGESDPKKLSAMLMKNSEVPPDFSPLAQNLLEEGYIDTALRDVLAQMGFTSQYKMEQALEEAAKDPRLMEELTTTVIAHLEAHFELLKKTTSSGVISGWPNKKDEREDAYAKIAPAVAARIVFTPARGLAKSLRDSKQTLLNSMRLQWSSYPGGIFAFGLGTITSLAMQDWKPLAASLVVAGGLSVAKLVGRYKLFEQVKQTGRNVDEVESYVTNLIEGHRSRDLYNGSYENYVRDFRARYPSLLAAVEPHSPGLSSQTLHGVSLDEMDALLQSASSAELPTKSEQPYLPVRDSQ